MADARWGGGQLGVLLQCLVVWCAENIGTAAVPPQAALYLQVHAIICFLQGCLRSPATCREWRGRLQQGLRLLCRVACCRLLEPDFQRFSACVFLPVLLGMPQAAISVTALTIPLLLPMIPVVHVPCIFPLAQLKDSVVTPSLTVSSATEHNEWRKEVLGPAQGGHHEQIRNLLRALSK